VTIRPIHFPRFLLLLAALAACAARGPAADASTNVEVALLAEGASVSPGRPFVVGLRMTMRPGWHTYWKNPGDAGLPLRIAWDLPPGFSAGPIEWPAPERIVANTLVSYGYHGDVLLTVEITPPAAIAGDSVTIAGKFDWLECAEECVPGTASLRLALPVRGGTPAPGPAAPRFAHARARIPVAPTGWTFAAEAGPRAVSLAFRPPPGIAPRRAALFVDEPLVVDYAGPQGFERAGGGWRVTAPPAANAQPVLARLTGVLVVEGRRGSGAPIAVQVDVPVHAGDPAPAAAQTEPPSRARTRLTALIAGVLAAIVAGLLAVGYALRRAAGGPRDGHGPG